MMAILALSVSGCLAQTTGLILVRLPTELQEYLALSDEQATKINTLNTQLLLSQSAKYERQIRVQLEITEWTAKENLDPLALGLRYAELETIRRETDDQHKNTISQVQSLLTAEQKAKVAVLQQALTLHWTACSGVNQNLLSAPGNVSSLSRWFDLSSFLVGPGPCSNFPTAVLRVGSEARP